jgi:hypothetical protein
MAIHHIHQTQSVTFGKDFLTYRTHKTLVSPVLTTEIIFLCSRDITHHENRFLLRRFLGYGFGLCPCLQACRQVCEHFLVKCISIGL